MTNVSLPDDLGYGDLGYMGSGIATPHIDALANDGVKLGRYYVNLCCTPSAFDQEICILNSL